MTFSGYRARPSAILLKSRVRHRSRATYSRQPRQVRKEATVTGSFVCSGSPVPGFFHRVIGPSDDLMPVSVMTKRLYYDQPDLMEFDSTVEQALAAGDSSSSSRPAV